MRCKNQLFIVSDTIQHNTENPFFNIALNTRKMFITIIETALFCRHCSKEHQLVIQHLKGMPFKGMQVRKQHLRPLLLSRSVGS